ncbi:MAG TPA: hypothetical protein ENJ09_03370 [Planctomycetes bacterium]|nr:hypothetical protein [Planctomycetota bacterium]
MKNRRKNKLPDSPFQFRFGIAIAGVSFVVVVVHAAVIHLTLGDLLGEAAAQRLLVATFATLAAGLPLAAVAGARILFPVAGPLARVRSHLRAVLDGEKPRPLVLRRGDPLGDVASMLNRILEERGTVPEPAKGAQPAATSLEGPPPALPTEPEYDDTPEYLV